MSMRHVCPYCGKKYKYKDVIWLKGKTKECHHCHKLFSIKKTYRSIPVVLSCVILTAINFWIFHSIADLSKKTLFMMIIFDAVVITAAMVVSPYLIRFMPLSKKLRKKGK